MSLPVWSRLLALGARERTLDEAVRASDFAELWASERAEVLLDVAHLAGLPLDELLVVLHAVLDAPKHEGARRWAEAGREALRADDTFAAGYAFGRILDALEQLADPQLAPRVREALASDSVAAALALGAEARLVPTSEDDLAHIIGGHRGHLPAPERDGRGELARAAVDRIVARSKEPAGA